MSFEHLVTHSLLCDVVKVLEDHGFTWADDDPGRKADVLVALCRMAEAMAGPVRDSARVANGSPT